ncbi:MAG TPA: RT0821/Lpp0805 family surface protein [Burkholderiales bacterium]
MKTTTPALVAVLVSLSLLPLPAPAEPPPHAKAHGWRKKNDPSYVGYTGRKWQRDYGVIEGRCNTAAVGAVVGGMLGGVVGSRISGPEDRPVAIILGTALGAVVGHAIGKELDASDRACMGHALELAGGRKSVSWTNQATGVAYRLTPTGAFKEGSRPCRRFTTELQSGKKKDTVKGAACRQGDGEWVFKSP